MAEPVLQNTLLKAAEQKIESQLTQKTRSNYLRIVTAGMKLALKDGPNSIIASLKKSQNPLDDCVNGVIGLMSLLFRESNGTMPMNAMIPAASVLLIQALDFAARAGIMKVGKPELEHAIQSLVEKLLPKLGVTPDRLTSLTQKVHGIMADPTKRALINKAGGGEDGAAQPK